MISRAISLLIVLSALSTSLVSDEGDKTGGWRLAKEKSEYLREHAENPVNWYPWGEEAFQAARERNVPILLSIGYSSCHWCHVMRRESFSDTEITQYLNENFVSIKVDREELPHVDEVYMDAVQLLTGSGGWPLTVFLDQDKKPFFGGTYFPPRTFGGRPGFKEVLETVTEVWQGKRDVIESGGARIVEMIQERDKLKGEAPEKLTFVHKGIDTMVQRYDSKDGGFGAAPKFPAPRLLILFTALSLLENRQDLQEIALHTLRAMARGGLFDQVGGGFHRYSVDAQWAVPHFEKMLYSQGLLGETYLEVYRMTGDKELKEIARRTLDALLRDFALPGGGFASSWNADSEEEEGPFYLWTPAQVKEVLPSTGHLLCAHLGITEKGNFEGGRSVPCHALSISELAEKHSLPYMAVETQILEGREKLFLERQKREHPRRDPKVILGWNALAVSALARGSVILGNPQYAHAAERAHTFANRKLALESGFLRRYAEGEAAHPATLRDAAFHLKACLDLYEATFQPAHVARARQVAEYVIRDYGPGEEGGAFYDTRKGVELLIPRRKTLFDSSLPSGNGVLARTFLRLHGLTGHARYKELAEGIVQAVLEALSQHPQATPEAMLAILMSVAPLPEVAVTGDLRHPLTRALLRPVQHGPVPFSVVAHRALGVEGIRAAQVIPLLQDREQQNNRPTVYLCVNFVCQKPENSPKLFQEQLKRTWQLPPQAPRSQPKK
ncbi:MAG: thioredoxin domain-containing protein, partial [Planctomycetota bacterium]